MELLPFTISKKYLLGTNFFKSIQIKLPHSFQCIINKIKNI
jgi:hypothetical protein